MDWSTQLQGMAAGNDGVVFTSGIADRVPRTVTLINPVLHEETTERALEYLFQPGYGISGKATHYMAEVEDFDPPPVWADFDIVFSGRVTKQPTPGVTVEIFVSSSGSATDTPLLDKRYTGGGTAILFAPQNLAMPSPPGICGGDWTVQFEGVSEGPSRLRIEDAGGNALLHIYRTFVPNTYKLDIYTGAGTDTYDMNTSPPGTIYETQQSTISWDQTGGKVRVWNGKELVVDTAIVNPMSLNAESVAYINWTAFPDTFPEASYTLLRMWSSAKFTDGVVDYDLPTYTDVDMAVAYEFEDIDGSEVIADSTPNGLHIDLTSYSNYIWHGSPNAYVGDYAIFEEILPVVFGDAWHVPTVMINGDFNERGLGAVVTDVVAMYANGAQLVQPASLLARNHAGYDNTVIINADNGLISQDPNSALITKDPHRAFCVNQRVAISGVGSTFAGQTPRTRRITPDPTHTFKRTGDEDDVYSIRVEGLSPNTGTFTELTHIETPFGDQDFTSRSSGVLDNVYGGDGVSAVFRFSYPVPEPVTANMQGDPTILAASPPVAEYVSPSVASNVVTQMLTLYGPRLTGSEFTTPDYNFLPYYVGYYVPDDRTTARKATDDILSSCLAWLEEDTDGVLVARKYTAPNNTPVFTFDQDTVVSVTRLQKFGAQREEDKPTALTVGFRRSYTSVDSASLPDIASFAARQYLTQEYRTRPVGTPTPGVVSPQFNTQLNSAGQAVSIGKQVLDLTRGEVVEIVIRYGAKAMFTDFYLGMEVAGSLPAFGYPTLGNKGGIVGGYEPIPYQGIVKVIVAIPEVS